VAAVGVDRVRTSESFAGAIAFTVSESMERVDPPGLKGLKNERKTGAVRVGTAATLNGK
jgi:hypothetical protein